MQCKPITTIVALSALLLVLGSCARRDRADAGAAAAPDTPIGRTAPIRGVQTPQVSGADSAVSEEAVPMKLTEQGRSRTDAPVSTPADPRDTAFEAQRFVAVPLPAQDTVLGALGSTIPASARDRAVLSSARSFLTAIVGGELATDEVSATIGPGGRAVLEHLIWAGTTLSEIRLGTVASVPGGDVSVQFRLIGKRRYALGELILENDADRWYTSDIQVELFDRDTTSRFDPGVVRTGGTL